MDELKAAEQLMAEVEGYSIVNPDLQRICQKLARKVKADINFLKKIAAKSRPTKKNKSCNLAYLTGVFRELKNCQNVTEIIYDDRRFGIVIDVICDNGKTWKKVVARNPQNLHMIWAAQGQYGNKDIVIKLEQYLKCSKKQCEFSPPAISVVFCNGITHELAEHIESLGVTVEGERVGVAQDVTERLQVLEMWEDSTDDEDYSTDEEAGLDQDPTRSVHADTGTPDQVVNSASDELEGLCERLIALNPEEKVFLDTTTMMVYVCDICNGGAEHVYNDKVLDFECGQERKASAVEVIQPVLDGRTLITCRSALDDYEYIIDVQGGPEERLRAERLIERLTVVPDRLSQRYLSLSSSGNIKDRAKVIFGTADYLKCPILTSNEGFIRGALAQGIHVPATIHQSRAFSEKKRLKQLKELKAGKT